MKTSHTKCSSKCSFCYFKQWTNAGSPVPICDWSNPTTSLASWTSCCRAPSNPLVFSKVCWSLRSSSELDPASSLVLWGLGCVENKLDTWSALLISCCGLDSFLSCALCWNAFRTGQSNITKISPKKNNDARIGWSWWTQQYPEIVFCWNSNCKSGEVLHHCEAQISA